MKKMAIIFLASVAMLSIGSAPVHAHCPLCAGAVGMVAASAKYYGLDASIVGLFGGAFAVSTGVFFAQKVKKQYIRLQFPAIVLASFILTVIPLLLIKSEDMVLPLRLFGETGSVLNRVYWMDKLVFGALIALPVTLLAFWLHDYTKKVRGRVLFPYQGIVFTLAVLSIAGLGLYLATGG